jgi:hypothetical protein
MEIEHCESLNTMRQAYVDKAIGYIPQEERSPSFEQEIVALFQEPVDSNLHPQFLQLMVYLPAECRSVSAMKAIIQMFKKAHYRHRSPAIRFMNSIPKSQRTLVALQTVLIFFQQVALKCRYDIFEVIHKIPEEERYEVVELVAQIFLSSKDWILMIPRAAMLIEAIYRIDPSKRKEASFFCQHYPLIFLQEDIFSTLSFFCSSIGK